MKKLLCLLILLLPVLAALFLTAPVRGFVDVLEQNGYTVHKAELYQRLEITVPADMVELQVTPMAGDILQIGSFDNVKLPAGQTVDATATILTGKNMHAIREVCITYYIWGVPFTMKTTVK